MKTNSVKKGSEKNIEMFQMSNDELLMISGGGEGLIVVGPDGIPIIIVRGQSKSFFSTFFSNFRIF